MPRKTDKVNSYRMKYGTDVRCKSCGQPTDSLMLVCERCQEARLYSEERRYMGEWLRSHPGAKIELAPDAKKAIHLAMFRYPQLAWCEVKVMQDKDRRHWRVPGQFPPGVCPACMQVYEGMGI